MKQLLKKNLSYSIKTSFLLIVAFCIIFSIAPIALFSIANMNNDIHADIAEHSRGSYDLLVRSPKAITMIEKNLGIVPENYIGGGRGGISLAQLADIKEREDIEIAAPVASLGYFTGLNTTLGVLPSPEKASTYRVEYSTSDGVNDYIYQTYEQIFSEILDDKYDPLSPIVKQFEMLPFMHPVHALFPLPVTYNHLVGIDPIEEEKLTGISFSPIEFGNESTGIIQSNISGVDILENAYAIPVIQLQDNNIIVKADIQVGELTYSNEDILGLMNEFGLSDELEKMEFENPTYIEFFDKLMQTPKKNEMSHELELTEFMNPFNSEAKGVVITKDGELLDIDEYGDTVSYASAVNWNNITRFYLADPVIYKQTTGGLQVKKIGEEHGVPVYREIEEKGTPIRDAQESEQLSLIIDPVGYYETGDKDKSLAASPLGIYQLEPVKYIDESGKEITLTPTYSAGSFVTAPAEGVTNIEAAEFVKGEQPIDAIRIKVAGIDRYTPEAAKKIESIANEIREMGLHVDVVAGSSLQMIDVDVEGVGVVQESWTTLGASGKIVNQWDITNLLLALAFALVSITYFINRIKLWSSEKEESIQLFKLLGWTYKDIKKLYRKEISHLLTISVILSLLGAAALMYTQEQYSQLVTFQIVVIALMLISVFFLVTRQLNAILYDDQKVNTRKVISTRSLVLRNVLYYRKSIVSTFLQILFVSSLAAFVYLALTESVIQTNLTVLGQYINAEVDSWNKILIISTYFLALITLVENISRLFQERKGEIESFKRIGWKIKSIHALFIKEIALWTGIALLIGSIISFILFLAFYPISMKSIFFILLTSLLLYGLILVVSYISLRVSLKKTFIL